MVFPRADPDLSDFYDDQFFVLSECCERRSLFDGLVYSKVGEHTTSIDWKVEHLTQNCRFCLLVNKLA